MDHVSGRTKLAGSTYQECKQIYAYFKAVQSEEGSHTVLFLFLDIRLPFIYYLFNHLILHLEFYTFFELCDVGDCLFLVDWLSPGHYLTCCGL